MSEAADNQDIPSGFDNVYGVDKDLVRAVETAIEEEDHVGLNALLVNLHSADIADLIEMLPRGDRADSSCWSRVVSTRKY